jgi:hypothetical protein
MYQHVAAGDIIRSSDPVIASASCARLVLFAFSLCMGGVTAPILAQSSPGTAVRAATNRAYLVQGTFAVRGLPFFSPNAIPALLGDYRVGGAPPGSAGQVTQGLPSPAPGSAP